MLADGPTAPKWELGSVPSFFGACLASDSASLHEPVRVQPRVFVQAPDFAETVHACATVDSIAWCVG